MQQGLSGLPSVAGEVEWNYGGGDRCVPGVDWPAGLVQLASSKLKETLCLKQ